MFKYLLKLSNTFSSLLLLSTLCNEVFFLLSYFLLFVLYNVVICWHTEPNNVTLYKNISYNFPAPPCVI